MSRATKGYIKTHQLKVEEFDFYVDGTGTAAIEAGGEYGTLTDNGTGDYTIALKYPGQRLLSLSVTPTTKVYANDADSDASEIKIKTFNDAGSATDAKFFVTAKISYSAFKM